MRFFLNSRSALAAGVAVGSALLGLCYLPSRSSRLFWRALAELGRASYHIFLLQGAYFWLYFQQRHGPGEFLASVVMMVTLCSLGWLLYRAEQTVRRAWPVSRTSHLAPRRVAHSGAAVGRGLRSFLPLCRTDHARSRANPCREGAAAPPPIASPGDEFDSS